MSLARRLLILQMVVLGVVVAALSVLTILDERRDSDAATRRNVSSIAEAVALSESTVTALRSPDPSAVLQPEAEQIRVATDTDFVVVMAPDGTRYTHPNPTLIGQQFEGHTERALAGETFTETFTGSLGPSIRAVAPVQADGQLLGLVSVGVTRERIGEEFAEGWPALLGILAVGVAVATLGSLLVSRHLRRQTLGLDPEELRRLYEHNDAVLRSIGEGLIVFGRSRDGRVRVDVVNDEARRLLWLPDGPITLYQLPETLQRIAPDSDEERDEVHVTADRVLMVRHAPVLWEGRRIGTVVTLRDHTELQRALGELDSARSVADSLRAQAHEYANRLHTIVTMVELGRGDDAVSFAAAELTTSQQLIDRLTAAVHEPALAALLLGKVTEAAQQGVEFTVTEDTALGPVRVLSPLEIVTVVGNLIDNAIDAARSGPDENPWVEVTVAEEASMLVVRVADSGPGMDPDTLELATTRGYSTKQVDGRPARQRGLGLALVAQVVARHGGRLRTEPSLAGMLVVEIPLPKEPGEIDAGEDSER
ncbi:sensor histidine kinase [Rhodococcus xishaensis]|uniref:histidine kinase n=1 Tax=Rhodococcus xishaensis TaxID=2487364 RepID=A0A438AQ10_9NOCA|nr:sensor histidine kinase [Rhodococcus xishaensis]RVW00697.1 sensor histidine kinase [Rhodococcus xishaensis]